MTVTILRIAGFQTRELRQYKGNIGDTDDKLSYEVTWSCSNCGPFSVSMQLVGESSHLALRTVGQEVVIRSSFVFMTYYECDPVVSSCFWGFVQPVQIASPCRDMNMLYDTIVKPSL